MNKYTELSDFEINLLVAQSVLPETQYDVIKQTMDIIQFLVDGSFGYRFFDHATIHPMQCRLLLRMVSGFFHIKAHSLSHLTCRKDLVAEF